MSITTDIQAAFASIIAANPDLVVTVKYRGQGASGVRVLTEKQTEPDLLGQMGTTVSNVRVDADDISEPERGANLIVDGVQVYVLNCRTSGGIRNISVSDTQPVEGV